MHPTFCSDAKDISRLSSNNSIKQVLFLCSTSPAFKIPQNEKLIHEDTNQTLSHARSCSKQAKFKAFWSILMERNKARICKRNYSLLSRCVGSLLSRCSVYFSIYLPFHVQYPQESDQDYWELLRDFLSKGHHMEKEVHLINWKVASHSIQLGGIGTSSWTKRSLC